MSATRVVFTAPGQVALEPFHPPAPGPAGALVRTLASVISPGTELACLHQLHNAQCKLPAVKVGYCLCGMVEQVGEQVSELAPGQRVVSLLPHASAHAAAASSLYCVPDTLLPEHAAMFTLVEICLQAVRKAEVRLGQTVAVLGLGVIGNLAAQLARASGAMLVVGIDPLAFRRDLAQRCGIDATVAAADAATLTQWPQVARADGFDVVIEATGAPAPIVTAFQLTRRLGRVVLLGSTRGLTRDVNFYSDVHKKGLTIIGAHSSARPAVDDHGAYATLATDIRTSIDLLASGRVNVAPLISDTIPYTRAAQAYARLSDRSQPLATIALDWRAS